MRFLRQSLVIASKDLRSEIRSKETLNASLSFAVVILLLFSFAFDPTLEQVEELAGGLLWLVFAFAGALVVNRSFARDLPNDCLNALIASPISGSALFFGKAVANFILLLALELISLPIFGLFYNVDWTTAIGIADADDCSDHMGHLRRRDDFQRHDGESQAARTDAADARVSHPDPVPARRNSIDGRARGGQTNDPSLVFGMRLLIGFDIIYTALALALVETLLVG